jgi:N-alpha-acetyltransferase 35, NatC auxiliary subunit
MDLFRIKCHNKSRQRRNLSNIVQELESLQLEVISFWLLDLICEIEKIDTELLELIPQKPIPGAQNMDGPRHAFPFCSWVYHIKLTVIETVLSMGFELELYQLYEYVLIYGYILNQKELTKLSGTLIFNAQPTTRANKVTY